MVGKERAVVKVNGRAESTNIIDRRNALPPLLRSFEFDGKTIGLDMTGPNPHNGGVLTDQQAIGKYLNDHSYYGLPDNQQTHLASSSLDPRVVDTIIAEAGNNVAGQRAVAAAIINRAKAQGKTPLQIVQQHGQFEGYSNPGSASVKAQQIASVRQNATKAFNDVLTGAVADPLKGGKDFRADASAGGLHAPHGTVSIGGNTFAMGNAPSSAVAAIDAVAPVPRSIPTSLSAYADTPAVALPPLPVPRPNPPQSVPLSLTDALRSKYTSVAPSADAASSYSGILPRLAPFVSEDHPRSNATATSGPVRTSGMVPTVVGASDILPGLNGWSINARNPDGTFRAQSTNIEDRTNGASLAPSHEAYIPERIQQQILAERNARDLPRFVSEDHPVSNAVMPPLPRPRPEPMYGNPMAPRGANQTILAPPGYGLEQPSGSLTSRSVHTVQIDPFTGNPVGSNAPFVSADHPLSNAVPAPASPKTIYYNSTAGNVALPKGVVPASVTRDLASIAGAQMNRSGSPDDRQAPAPQLAPTPMPARPSALNAPYVPGPNGFTVANKDASSLPAGVTDSMAYGPSAMVPETGPVRAIQQISTQPTTKHVLNPAYAKWVANPVAISKLQDIHDFRDDATMAAQGSAARLPAPPKYISIPVPGSSPQVPLPRPRPQLVPVQQPRATGGLLGLLFPGGFGGGPSIVSAPVGGNPNITYGPVIAAGNFAEGSPNASFEKQNGMGSVTKSMAASSRWNGGY